MIYLSHILDENTPTYGNRNKFSIERKSDIANGDIANDSFISSTVHIGTHIDMPYHFYGEGQTIENYSADFWSFKKILFLDIKSTSLIIGEELISLLTNIEDIGYELLIVKTGICESRNSKEFWNENYGFHPDIASYLRDKFTDIRVFGFDSISVSSFQERKLGRESHKAFLNPQNSILLLEDMDLRNINQNTKFKEIIISPLRISKCDGLPCTIIGKLND